MAVCGVTSMYHHMCMWCAQSLGAVYKRSGLTHPCGVAECLVEELRYRLHEVCWPLAVVATRDHDQTFLSGILLVDVLSVVRWNERIVRPSHKKRPEYDIC